MKTSITINGHTYSSIEKMPTEVRRQYESAMGLLADKDGNGIPDVLEGKDTPREAGSGNPVSSSFVVKLASTRIKVNGQEYSRWEDVPPEVRAAIEKARAASGVKSLIGTSVPASRRVAISPRPAPASEGLRIGLPWLMLLLLVAVLAGFLIAWKLR